LLIPICSLKIPTEHVWGRFAVTHSAYGNELQLEVDTTGTTEGNSPGGSALNIYARDRSSRLSTLPDVVFGSTSNAIISTGIRCGGSLDRQCA
jgi:hypothetical protein